MEKKRSGYVSPKAEEFVLELENSCLASSVDWSGTVGVEGDYEQTDGEW